MQHSLLAALPQVFENHIVINVFLKSVFILLLFIWRLLSCLSLNIEEQSQIVWDRVGAFARIQDEQLLVLVCRMFNREAPQLLASLKAALKASNTQDAAIYAHSLKAAAANVGAEQCRAFCAEMERLAKSGNSAGVAQIVPKFDDAFKYFQQALSAAGWI